MADKRAQKVGCGSLSPYSENVAVFKSQFAWLQALEELILKDIEQLKERAQREWSKTCCHGKLYVPQRCS